MHITRAWFPTHIKCNKGTQIQVIFLTYTSREIQECYYSLSTLPY